MAVVAETGRKYVLPPLRVVDGDQQDLERVVAVQASMLRGIGDALQRLRGSKSTGEMIARATAEICAGCGFDRCLLFRADGVALVLESAHFVKETEWEEEFREYARAHPPVLDPRDAEIQLFRRRVPILVLDPGSTRGMRDLVVGAWRSPGYVAAPIIVRGSVIGALHADRYFSGEQVDPFARDVLATFSAGYGYALERTALLDRTRSELRRMQDMMAQAETSIGELISSGVSLRSTDRGEVTAVARRSSQPLQGMSRIGALLTRRELEVVELMAQGASNGDIATELVISEGTVKSHVKHILRKMRAANRAQAVSTYMRIVALSHTS
jgi:DNA-binding CsgD family transcriptional regulator